MPNAILENLYEPHDGHRLFCFSVRYALLYLLRTVAPNLIPRPFSTWEPFLALPTDASQLPQFGSNLIALDFGRLSRSS